MVSKVKVDSIETTAGTGTIALNNQLSGMTVASLPTSGALPALDGSALTSLTSGNLSGALPALDGSSLTGVGVAGIVSAANATAITIDSSEQVGVGTTSPAISGIYSDGTNNTITGTYLTIRDDDADQCGILELASSQSANGKAVGGISFINADNASSEYQRKNIASITCRTVTSDNNDNDDSGGDIVFTNKPEYGDVAERLRITSDGRGKSQFTAKGWARFNGTGTPAISDSHNVSSISDNETGQIGVQFANNMANANYSAMCNGWWGYAWTGGAHDVTTSNFKATTSNGSAYTDANNICVLWFGD